MEKINTQFTQALNLELPIIMAPMFLVSNEAMLLAAMNAGILGCFPTLNFRRDNELEQILDHLNTAKAHLQGKGNYGVNLIVQKSNPLYQKHLDICLSKKVPFFITSLGNPQGVIEGAHSYGAKVYCDVTNLKHAEIVASKNPDGFIAVGQGAGGHAGPYPLHLLVSSLKKNFPEIPVIAAGGISHGSGILSMLALGATGLSIGTRFIASEEATVSQAYKDAIVNSSMDDIVLTEKISGTPCTIINTPFAKKIGYKQNFFERLLSNNKQTKKYFKMLIQIKGMKQLESAVKPGNYNNLWCAGQSVEMIEQISKCSEIIEALKNETLEAYQNLETLFEYGKAGQITR